MSLNPPTSNLTQILFKHSLHTVKFNCDMLWLDGKSSRRANLMTVDYFFAYLFVEDHFSFNVSAAEDVNHNHTRVFVHNLR